MRKQVTKTRKGEGTNKKKEPKRGGKPTKQKRKGERRRKNEKTV